MEDNIYSIFNQIKECIFVLDRNQNILFKNVFAKNIFGNIENFKKIKKYFSIDDLVIFDDKKLNYSLFDIITESNENIYLNCSYQYSQDDYYYFEVSAIKNNQNIILILKDITETKKYEFKDIEYETSIKLLQEEQTKNKELQKSADKAEKLALKTAVYTKILTNIRNANDIQEIINIAISELHTVLGAYKTYFLKLSGGKYKIKDIIPTIYENEINKEINFNGLSPKILTNNTFYSSICIKESSDSTEVLRKGTYRIIIPIHDDKKVIGAIVLLTVQKYLITDNQDLIQAVSERITDNIVKTKLTKDIQKQNEKLKKALKELNETQLQLINTEKMASIGQLVAGVAHEINTPLGSINANNLMIKKIINAELTENKINILKDINNIDTEAIKRIDKIVKSLKKFVRLDESEVQLADINKELDLTLEIIKHETKNKVEIIKEYSEIPQINCYVNMLNQVFMNILVNASQSIKEKGIIRIKTYCTKTHLIVKIKDNGCGIKETDKQKIFSVGFTTKGIGAGTGLGLAISKKIVEQRHKGKLTFTSKENEGTEFTVKIPLNL